MLQGFKQFILRDNVLDLAVAVVMGVAFGAVVTALVKDIITPFIAALVGKPDFSAQRANAIRQKDKGRFAALSGMASNPP